jgi:2',3'-cyclic-nucleotide 2'-phosphodiesterase (5'-nucleotidase family)
MKKNPLAILLSALIFFVNLSCHNSYETHAAVYTNYRMTTTLPADTVAAKLLAPYSKEVNRTMNDIVGTAPVALEKAQPECTLGNFMCDAFLTMATEKYGKHVDAAFMNYGGIRLTQLPAGPVTTGKIFELMPFDNIIVLQQLSGQQLQQFLDNAAARNGWPVAGLTMEIRDKKAVNVKVGGVPLSATAIYTIANSDYVANGGDETSVLRSIPQESNGYLMRDALFDYIRKLKSQGKGIVASIENRVRYAE